MELIARVAFPIFLGERKFVLWYISAAILGFLVYALVFFSDQFFVLPIALIGLVYLYLSVRFPIVWIVTSILLHIPLFLQSSGEVTTLEELIGFYIYGVLGIWFVNKLIVRRETILNSRIDRALLLFLLLSFASVILAIQNESDMGRWFREAAVFLGYLFYFPVREVIRKDRRNLSLILAAFILACLVIGGNNLINYRSSIVKAVAYWQIWGSRKVTSTTFFLAAVVGGGTLFFFVRSWFWRLVAGILTAFFSVVLLVAFARGFWVAAILALGLAFLLMDWKRKRRFLATSVFVVGLTVLSAFLVLGTLTNPFLKSVSTRFLTLEATTADRSLHNRNIESAAVLEQISTSPLLGHGLGASFKTYNLFSKEHVESWYVHNGFLFLWFKLGLIGLLLFLYIYMSMMGRSYRFFREEEEPWRKGFGLATLCILFSMLVVSYTSGQFYERAPVLICGLLWGGAAAGRSADDEDQGEG